MDTADIPAKHPSLWLPISNPRVLAALGKLAEELGECQAAVARCIIQGVDGKEPETGKPNRQWLGEEISDVTALFALVEGELGSLLDTIRVRRKYEMKHAWLDMITADQAKREGQGQ